MFDIPAKFVKYQHFGLNYKQLLLLIGSVTDFCYTFSLICLCVSTNYSFGFTLNIPVNLVRL